MDIQRMAGYFVAHIIGEETFQRGIKFRSVVTIILQERKRKGMEELVYVYLIDKPVVIGKELDNAYFAVFQNTGHSGAVHVSNGEHCLPQRLLQVPVGIFMSDADGEMFIAKVCGQRGVEPERQVHRILLDGAIKQEYPAFSVHIEPLFNCGKPDMDKVIDKSDKGVRTAKQRGMLMIVDIHYGIPILQREAKAV